MLFHRENPGIPQELALPLTTRERVDWQIAHLLHYVHLGLMQLYLEAVYFWCRVGQDTP